MKKFKKRIAMLLAVACLLSLAACGKNKEPGNADKETIAPNQDDIFEGIESLATENAGADVGSYVMVPEADLIWEDVEGGVAITSYTGTATAIELPAQVGGKDVVEIRGGAFSSNIVVGVKLPDTLITIGEEAFFYVTTLVEVEFGKNVKTIGKHAFEGCIALTTVELNEGLELIDEMAFTMDGSLLSIKLPTTLKQIAAGAFCWSGLNEIIIPSSVGAIGKQAFGMCENLKKVVIKDGLAEIGEEAFSTCEALESIEIPASVVTFGYLPFIYCEKLTVYAPAGSAAETYCTENGINFKSN